MKFILVVGFITLFTFGHSEICPNCSMLLEEVLNKTAATDAGPFFRVVKVNALAELRAPGHIDPVYSINADLMDENMQVKTCEVGITGKPILKSGYFVTFWCKGEKIIIKRLA